MPVEINFFIQLNYRVNQWNCRLISFHGNLKAPSEILYLLLASKFRFQNFLFPLILKESCFHSFHFSLNLIQYIQFKFIFTAKFVMCNLNSVRPISRKGEHFILRSWIFYCRYWFPNHLHIFWSIFLPFDKNIVIQEK